MGAAATASLPAPAVTPTATTFGAAIEMCHRSYLHEEALGLLEAMREHGVEPDGDCYCAAARSCASIASLVGTNESRPYSGS